MVNELKRLAQRLIEEKWNYKKATKPYVKDVMCYMTQEDLMRALDGLNLKELRQIQGCGVPGDAWRHCNELIRKRTQEIDLIIQDQGQKAHCKVDAEDVSGVVEDGPTGV